MSMEESSLSGDEWLFLFVLTDRHINYECDRNGINNANIIVWSPVGNMLL